MPELSFIEFNGIISPNSIKLYPVMGRQFNETACNVGDPDSIPGSGRSPRRGHGNQYSSIPVFLLGKSHGQRNLVGYSSWGQKESDTTVWLTHTHTHTSLNKGAEIILWMEGRGSLNKSMEAWGSIGRGLMGHSYFWVFGALTQTLRVRMSFCACFRQG